MSAFVRQLAVLSVLWSVCELLLPDGRQQQLVRMAVSLLVMVALISGMENLFRLKPMGLPAFTDAVAAAEEQSYATAALRAAANQAEGICTRMAQRAGYTAKAAVYLTGEGAVEHIDLWLTEGTAPPLMDADRLCALIAGYLDVAAERVRLGEAVAHEDT